MLCLYYCRAKSRKAKYKGVIVVHIKYNVPIFKYLRDIGELVFMVFITLNTSIQPTPNFISK